MDITATCLCTHEGYTAIFLTLQENIVLHTMLNTYLAPAESITTIYYLDKV